MTHIKNNRIYIGGCDNKHAKRCYNRFPMVYIWATEEGKSGQNQIIFDGVFVASATCDFRENFGRRRKVFLTRSNLLRGGREPLFDFVVRKGSW